MKLMNAQQITSELRRRDPDWRANALGLGGETGLRDQAIADELHQRDTAWWADIQAARARYAGYLEETGKAV